VGGMGAGSRVLPRHRPGDARLPAAAPLLQGHPGATTCRRVVLCAATRRPVLRRPLASAPPRRPSAALAGAHRRVLAACGLRCWLPRPRLMSSAGCYGGG